MSIVVLDASVAAKFYVRERDSELAQALVDREFNFLVPDIFFSEVANAIRKQHREDGQLDAASVRLAIDDLLMIGAEPVTRYGPVAAFNGNCIVSRSFSL